MRHAAKHQSRPLKDDRNVLQLISAGIQVAKLLRDANAMTYMDQLYLATENTIHERSCSSQSRLARQHSYLEYIRLLNGEVVVQSKGKMEFSKICSNGVICITFHPRLGQERRNCGKIGGVGWRTFMRRTDSWAIYLLFATTPHEIICVSNSSYHQQPSFQLCSSVLSDTNVVND